MTAPRHIFELAGSRLDYRPRGRVGYRPAQIAGWNVYLGGAINKSLRSLFLPSVVVVERDLLIDTPTQGTAFPTAICAGR